MKKINFKGTEVNYIEINANPEHGFYFPFGIIIPTNLNDTPNVIYASNLTPNNSEKCSTIVELINLIKNDDNKFNSIDPLSTHLSISQGNPIVIPFVPRLRNFRPNFLGRDCLLNDFKLEGNDKKFEKYMFMYSNLADQHRAMIEYAINYLKKENINASNQAILCGYSEGAKFASHLALLHPKMVKAVVAGGTGGAVSMPISEIDGYEFVYPTGISDLKNFDFEAFSNISFFYYMGDMDKSDSAIPYFKNYIYTDNEGNERILRDECGNQTPYIDEFGNQAFILDENGNYTAKFNLFSDSEVNAINKVLGTKIQDRFKKQQQIYEKLNLKAVFKLYKGDHLSVFNERSLIFSDVDSFMNNYAKDGLVDKKVFNNEKIK